MVIMKIKQFITQAYSSVRYKSKRRGEDMPLFTKHQLEKWLIENKLLDMWIAYVESGFIKGLRPSIDRIDDYGKYEFSNMQLITWRENLIKGVNGEKHHKNSQNQNRTKSVFIWDKYGFLIKECDNYRDASIFLQCHLVSISRATTGKRKTLKGYTLTNSKNFALTGEELTIKP